MEIDSVFLCAYCFEENDILVDGSGALSQRYVEDCQVCCRPNLLIITIGPDRQATSVTAEPE